METEYTLSWLEFENQSYFDPDPSLIAHSASSLSRAQVFWRWKRHKNQANILIDISRVPYAAWTFHSVTEIH